MPWSEFRDDALLHLVAGDQREPGWWIQQLIKLGGATQIANISSTYVVWDGKEWLFNSALTIGMLLW